jgi:hypothetical protein
MSFGEPAHLARQRRGRPASRSRPCLAGARLPASFEPQGKKLSVFSGQPREVCRWLRHSVALLDAIAAARVGPFSCRGRCEHETGIRQSLATAASPLARRGRRPRTDKIPVCPRRLAQSADTGKLGDLGLDGGLQQPHPRRATSSSTPPSSRSEPNNSSISARTRSIGDTRKDTGVGSFLCLQGFERNLRPPSIYTADRTPPSRASGGVFATGGRL